MGWKTEETAAEERTVRPGGLLKKATIGGQRQDGRLSEIIIWPSGWLHLAEQGGARLGRRMGDGW